MDLGAHPSVGTAPLGHGGVRTLDTRDKAAYFPAVHRHWVGAVLGIAALFAVALAPTAELLASAGAICTVGAQVPCVIGSGGGLAVRAGYRFHSPIYIGGSYEF